MTTREWIEIGSGHRYSLVYFEGEGEMKGSLYGMYEEHLNPALEACGGFIPFNTFGKTTGWDVINVEPLTLSPSLDCGGCPSHGFIKEGKWVE